jgi:hypothetical protein
LYHEKSQNIWGTHFVKAVGGMELIALDHQEPKRQQLMPPTESKSQLPMPILTIISLFFNVELMQQSLASFELDTEKMPLGKLQREHILKASFGLIKI